MTITYSKLCEDFENIIVADDIFREQLIDFINMFYDIVDYSRRSGHDEKISCYLYDILYEYQWELEHIDDESESSCMYDNLRKLLNIVRDEKGLKKYVQYIINHSEYQDLIELSIGIEVYFVLLLQSKETSRSYLCKRAHYYKYPLIYLFIKDELLGEYKTLKYYLQEDRVFQDDESYNVVPQTNVPYNVVPQDNEPQTNVPQDDVFTLDDTSVSNYISKLGTQHIKSRDESKFVCDSYSNSLKVNQSTVNTSFHNTYKPSNSYWLNNYQFGNKYNSADKSLIVIRPRGYEAYTEDQLLYLFGQY